MHLADEKGNPIPGKSVPVVLDNFEARWVPHPDGITDLCALPLAPILLDAKNKKINVFTISLDTSLIASDADLLELDAYERILMVGYPIGLWDSVNNMPLFRAGVTATTPSIDYEGRPEFVIDAACFPGSSGSPVLLWDRGTYMTKDGATNVGSRIKLLGILYSGPVQTTEGEIKVITIPTSRQIPIIVSNTPINLGFVIKAKKLLDFDTLFKTPK